MRSDGKYEVTEPGKGRSNGGEESSRAYVCDEMVKQYEWVQRVRWRADKKYEVAEPRSTVYMVFGTWA